MHAGTKDTTNVEARAHVVSTSPHRATQALLALKWTCTRGRLKSQINQAQLTSDGRRSQTRRPDSRQLSKQLCLQCVLTPPAVPLLALVFYLDQNGGPRRPS